MPGETTTSQRGEVSLLTCSVRVNYFRLLHLRVLLYRPSFTAFCAAARPAPSRAEQADPPVVGGALPLENELARSFRGQCAGACVKTACELVESVARATGESATGAWWFSLFCKSSSPLVKSDSFMAVAYTTPNKTLSQVASSLYWRSAHSLKNKLSTSSCSPGHGSCAALHFSA